MYNITDNSSIFTHNLSPSSSIMWMTRSRSVDGTSSQRQSTCMSMSMSQFMRRFSSLPRHTKPDGMEIEKQDNDLPNGVDQLEELHERDVVMHLRKVLCDDVGILQDKYDYNDDMLAKSGSILEEAKRKKSKTCKAYFLKFLKSFRCYDKGEIQRKDTSKH